MNKERRDEYDTQPATLLLDYGALKECMKLAIQETLLYERERRERVITLYFFSTLVFGVLAAVFIPIGLTTTYDSSIITTLGIIGIGASGFVATQIAFALWALTRWF